jgi:hypothetical protein
MSLSSLLRAAAAPAVAVALTGAVAAGVPGVVPVQAQAAKDDAGQGHGRETAPGQAGTAPGQSGATPGQSGSTPAQGDAPPGQAGATPGQSGTAPGRADDGAASTTAPAPAAPAAARPGVSAAPAVAFDTPALAPTVAKAVGVAAAAGVVRIRTAGGRAVHTLPAAAAAIPTGAHVDARDGAVELTSAVDAAGTTQTATFSGGVFAVHQDAATGLTRIVLAGGDFSRCPARRATGTPRAVAAAKRRKPVRRLWGTDDHGRFQTRGKGAVGTVRGTRWLTEDFCDGTRTTVVQGTVAVRDLGHRRTVVVRAGHSYFARTR